MAFVKLVKNKAYFKRYQTKYRRRREGKTDYYSRVRLVQQDKDKYNSPKYRFVARITASKVITQIIYATLKGDRVLVAADSSELKRFGLKAGLTNYASAYATGLLLARRLLTQLKMDKIYVGVEKITGEKFDVADDPKERRPFYAILDVGIRNTTTGNRVFGALKGATDGGLHIPHSENRFPGFIKGQGEQKNEYKVAEHKARIFGTHVDKYINILKKGDKDRYTKQFSKWDATLKEAKVDSVEKLYTKIHADIRKDPIRPKKKQNDKPNRDKFIKKRQVKLSNAQRKDKIKKRIALELKKAQQSKKK